MARSSSRSVAKRASWFDDYVFADDNLGHTELTESLCDWIVERVETAGKPVDRGTEGQGEHL